MIYSFADFELDVPRRELRLRGREVSVQPRVFELLLCLLRNQDRVVSKQELLETLWPDAVVADGALQRAVSLARSALRTGNADRAIRTFSRTGYRFCLDALEESAGGARKRGDPDSSGEANEPLMDARRAFDDRRWEDAATRFADADQIHALAGVDLQRWAQAEQTIGRLQDAVTRLERAIAAHSTVGERLLAARAAIDLANLQYELRNIAVAQGWRERAATLLKGLPEAREHGLFEWFNSRYALYSGDTVEALRASEAAQSNGRRRGDADLQALGLLYSGHAHIASGDIDKGSAQQDEAATMVLSGEVTPWAAGLIYCGVIWACMNRGDWARATEWTAHFTRMCEQTDVDAFPGLCRLHRAEVLAVRGDLTAAKREIDDARNLLARSAPWAEGDAYRVLAEIELALGEMDAAEGAFRRAYELGWDPQPGWALLKVRRGEAASGLRALQRSLAGTSWPNLHRRGILLANLVVVAIAAGDPQRAREAMQELDANPQLWATTLAGQAMETAARAEIQIADGNSLQAVAELRQAAKLWDEVGSPPNVARVRARLAEVLEAEGDAEAADLERKIVVGLAEKIGASLPLQTRSDRA